MANRNFNTVQALEKQVKQLHFRIGVNTAGAITSFVGLGASASLHPVGVYRLSLQDTYPTVSSVHTSWQPATTASANLAVESRLIFADTTSSAPRLDVALVSGSAPAGVVSAGVAGTIHVSAFLKNSTV